MPESKATTRIRVAFAEYDSQTGAYIESVFPRWHLDVSRHPGSVCFVPEMLGSVVASISHVSEKCPGLLVGVYHKDGQGKADEWRALNPNWRSDYS